MQGLFRGSLIKLSKFFILLILNRAMSSYQMLTILSKNCRTGEQFCPKQTVHWFTFQHSGKQNVTI